MALTKLKTIAVVGAAAAAMTVGIMPANAAAATWTVNAGSAPSGKVVKISAPTTGLKPRITFTDVDTSTVLHCTSGSADGQTTAGSGQSGAGIGSIDGASTTWTGCTGPLGIVLNPVGSGTWLINAVSYSTKNGVTTGTITNAHADVTGTGCSFTVDGSVPIAYNNTSHIMHVQDSSAGLTVSNVTGCFGAVNNGDHASFQAGYRLRAKNGAYNPITITKP